MVDHKTAMAIGYRIPGEMWPTELGWLYYTLNQSKIHVEVGTFCGRSLWATCAGMMQLPAKVIAVDANIGHTVPVQWVQGVRQLTIQMIHEMTSARVELIESFSVDAARKLTEQGMTGQADSVFIDGNHHTAEVVADCKAWWPLLRDGGIMAGHDYWSADPGVMDAVQQQFGGRHQVAANTRIWWVRK